MELFGKNLKREELRPFVGRMDQVASIRMVTIDDGPGHPMRAALVDAGNGLSFIVALDRCLDLVSAHYHGRALGWRARVGDVAPHYYDRHDAAWLRSYAGGLLATCGLSNVGPPQTEDATGNRGLHGRIGNTPAENVGIRQAWEGDDYVLEVRGSMREAVTFGENLVLHRVVRVVAGSGRIEVRDELVNEGYTTAGYQLLYHCNIGWPALAPGGHMSAPSAKVTPRDDVAEKGLADWINVHTPVAGYEEQVFYHDMTPDAQGWVTAAIINPALGEPAQPFGVGVRYKKDTLPRFAQWKQLGQQDYVMGLEPATCSVGGRAADEAAGILSKLEPGESRSFAVDFIVADGEEAVTVLGK